MALPPHIAQAVALARIPMQGTPGDCEGARFHSPKPLFVQATALVSPEWGAVPEGAPEALLCGTCRDNLLLLQRLIGEYGAGLSWEVRREFGNDIRRLAYQGWNIFAPQEVS
jgi:hypothetical protein